MLLYVSYTTFVVFENIDHKKVVYENISHFLMVYKRFAVISNLERLRILHIELHGITN
jgi:hypothetical protein